MNKSILRKERKRERGMRDRRIIEGWEQQTKKTGKAIERKRNDRNERRERKRKQKQRKEGAKSRTPGPSLNPVRKVCFHSFAIWIFLWNPIQFLLIIFLLLARKFNSVCILDLKNIFIDALLFVAVLEKVNVVRVCVFCRWKW